MSIPFNDIKKIKMGKFSLTSDVFQAIQEASAKYNVSFKYMLAMAAKESAFDPNAKAKTSSAKGLYQFIDSTWNEMWKEYKTKPSPTNPFANADAGARYVKVIQNKLKTNDPALLYLGHFLGPTCAFTFLQELRKDNNVTIDTVVNEKQLRANKTVFYHKDKSLKTIKEIYEWSENSIKKIMDMIII